MDAGTPLAVASGRMDLRNTRCRGGMLMFTPSLLVAVVGLLTGVVPVLLLAVAVAARP